ncbi:MAG: P-II family nitrogen regulator [Ruminococcaceae bacterium]|nr:P-II family nitrogen regulator [Oscillospiraceae bacterium]
MNFGGDDINCNVSIINPNGMNVLTEICTELCVPIALVAYGRGTASKGMIDLLGAESREKRIVFTLCNSQMSEKLISEHRKRLYIDAPGNGVIMSVPLKSVGGGKTLAFINGGPITRKTPEMDLSFELIMAIANEGYTDQVMSAARLGGARGGTVIHAKGTGALCEEKFFKVSIAEEKEIIIIVSKTEEKEAIMSSILKHAGPNSDAGTMVVSMPLTAAAGFSVFDD